MNPGVQGFHLNTFIQNNFKCVYPKLQQSKYWINCFKLDLFFQNRNGKFFTNWPAVKMVCSAYRISQILFPCFVNVLNQTLGNRLWNGTSAICPDNFVNAANTIPMAKSVSTTNSFITECNESPILEYYTTMKCKFRSRHIWFTAETCHSSICRAEKSAKSTCRGPTRCEI